MKKNYESPQIEVIEIEIEDAVLAASTPAESSATINSYGWGGEAW